MSLQAKLQDLTTRIATEFKKVYGILGSLSSLSTTNKSSIVSAINEVKSSGLAIDDNNVGPSSVYSSNKVEQRISQAKSELIGGADNLHDTFKEFQDLIAADEQGFAAFSTALGYRVRFDAAQTLTDPQKAQAIANIGAILATDIGDVNNNFVTVFEAALQ